MHNHNLPSWVVFADLVKAFDTINHKLLLQILSKYSAPTKLCHAIERLYKDISVKFEIGKLAWKIGQSFRVKQCNYMAPALFSFLVMVFVEMLEEEWTL